MVGSSLASVPHLMQPVFPSRRDALAPRLCLVMQDGIDGAGRGTDRTDDAERRGGDVGPARAGPLVAFGEAQFVAEWLRGGERPIALG